MSCYQSIKTLEGKIPPRVFYFVSLFFPNPIIARWASQGCQGSSLASLAPMNGRLRLPPLTAFAHLANLTIKERKGKKGKEIQCNTATTTKNQKRQRFVTSGTIFIPIQNTKHRQCHLQRLTFLKQRQVQWLGA